VGGSRVLLLVRAHATGQIRAVNPLREKILRRIRKDGPIGIAEYMQIALMDPEHGYYMRRDPLGAAGDFITAPEVSQIFGELIGLFFVQAWEDRGRPSAFHLVELGPGRGTLMADILRAAKLRPAFGQAVKVTLVEASPALRAVQQRTLNGARVRWAEGLDDLDGAPLFVVANEFLDALPAHQFVKAGGGWRARTVAAAGDMLVFAMTEQAALNSFPDYAVAPLGAVLELGTEALSAVRTLSDRVVRSGGVALLIDYGTVQPGFGDTFQAVHRHGYVDPLAEPGEADLTFHVDFAALAAAAKEEGARISGPVMQADFLAALGIHVRAERLKRAQPDAATDIEAATHRLMSPNEMGTLFKVMGLAAPGSPHLPGFPC
jgi:NADH dehydrogenase [ubiquinone] 1 alpha subcomplex assembly factor 7